MKSRLILATQAVVALGLCLASLIVLWQAGSAVVAHEQRRQRTLQRLTDAEGELATSGASGLSLIPDWPESLGPDEWMALDDWLSKQAAKALAGDPISTDGGYYLVGFNRFIGRNPASAESAPTHSADISAPPPDTRALVEAQVRKALDADRSQSLLVQEAPRTLAIRTAPVWINDRQVAATWALATLDDAHAMASAVGRYRLSAALALGGIGVAMLTALWLARAARRHSRERLRLEGELQRTARLAALGKLVAGVAHEVRNPLAGIRSTAQLCDRGIELDRQSAADLIAEVDRLDAIVARLLQFSRVGKDELQPANFNEVVVDAIRMLRPRASEASIVIELDLDHGLPPLPLASTSIIQVVRNLVTNAIDAMPNGGILRLQTGRDAGTRRVHLIVSDSGPGLSAAAREHLFEPFFTTKTNGTGLGLAIAREIAFAHGGDLSANARADAPGAAFRLSLPIAVPDRASARVTKPERSGSGAFAALARKPAPLDIAPTPQPL